MINGALHIEDVAPVLTFTNTHHCNLSTSGYVDWNRSDLLQELLTDGAIPIEDLYPQIRFDEGRFLILSYDEIQPQILQLPDEMRVLRRWRMVRLSKSNGFFETEEKTFVGDHNPCSPFIQCQALCMRYAPL